MTTVVGGQATAPPELDPRDEAGPAPDPGGVGRNVAALATGQLFTWAMTLAWTVVVPRLLGPGGLGLIVTGISVTGILQIVLGAGTGVYVAREIVISPGRGARLVATAAIARLLLVPFFLVAVFVWAQIAGYSAEGKIVLYLSGGATVLYLLAEPMQSFFQAIERMQYLALSNAIYKAAQGLVGIALTLLGLGAIGFAGCWMVMSGVVVLLSIRWVRRYVRLQFRTTRRELLEVARGSVVYWTAGVFYMIYLWIDTVMLSVMTNPTVVGWYGVPTKLFQTMLFVPALFTTAWLPRMVKAFQRSRQDLHTVARTPIELVLSLALPIGTVIAASAGPVIRLVYGPAYAHAVPVLIILGLGLVPMYLNIMLCQVCVAAGRQRHWTWLMVAATFFNPAVNGVLIPLTQHRFGNGAIGAAIALVATELLVAGGGIMVAGREVLGLSTAKRLGRTGCASAGMGLVVYALSGFGPIVSLVAGGVTLIVLGLLVGAISPDERRLLWNWTARRLGKVRASVPVAPPRLVIERSTRRDVDRYEPIPPLPPRPWRPLPTHSEFAHRPRERRGATAGEEV